MQRSWEYVLRVSFHSWMSWAVSSSVRRDSCARRDCGCRTRSVQIRRRCPSILSTVRPSKRWVSKWIVIVNRLPGVATRLSGYGTWVSSDTLVIGSHWAGSCRTHGSTTTTFSNNVLPEPISLHCWISSNGLYSYCRISSYWRCRSCIHSAQGIDPGTRTRNGSVLMSTPTICSIPGRSPERPETVTPRTTSLARVYRLNSSAQQPWIRVSSESWCCSPTASRRAVSSSASSRPIWS